MLHSALTLDLGDIGLSMLGWRSSVFSSISTGVLIKKGAALCSSGKSRDVSAASTVAQFRSDALGAQPFLRIPPFPGSRIRTFCRPDFNHCQSDHLVDRIKELRVGGTYWAAQPELPPECLLVRNFDALPYCAGLSSRYRPVLWQRGSAKSPIPDSSVIVGECDPWHMVSAAAGIVVEPDDELRLIGAISGVPVYLFDRLNGLITLDGLGPKPLLRRAFSSVGFEDPFTQKPIDHREAVELAGFWRGLIDSNRGLGAGFGFAFWKQDHVAPLLWGGVGAFAFPRDLRNVPANAAVAVWRSKMSREQLVMLEGAEAAMIEVEDGFLRSRGLGADCVPPLSITVDRLGSHFDPAQPSELERLLADREFDAALLERARLLREAIVESGLGKYDRAVDGVSQARRADRPCLLVPGQVEDDRAVLSGGCGLVSNLELLARVRAQAPDAYILYKPHPDVLAGHRRGAIPPNACLKYADEIVGDVPFSSLIEAVDEVHVNTSLAGFEALLRGKTVTTYGVPFYAGWGLTRDVGPVPPRRNRNLTIDELVAAALLLYPRYLDPITKLPCPAEIVVARLSADAVANDGVVVGARRLQGKIMRYLRRLAQ